MAASLEEQCVTAFKQCSHDVAIQLLPQLQDPAALTTEVKIFGELRTNVSLLHLAAYHGWLDIIKTLKIFSKHDSNGYTPLHYAATRDSVPVIAYLITELKYDPHTPESTGNLPLHFACLNGHLNATKYFITEQHCDPTCRGQYGRTPLHKASDGGHMDIIKYLITEQGCDPNTLDNDSDLPIHIACLGGHLSATKYFITEKHCDPKCRGQYGRTPLHTASDGGHMDIIKYLITEQGCDPNTLDNDGDLPIHIACLCGHLSATKYFITEQHCDPTCRGRYGRTPLHKASDGGHMDIIKYLITEQGCDPNTLDNDGDLPIHIACLGGHLSATKYFITEQHCDPTCRGRYGRTPLHKASDGGHMDIIKYLITEQSCDPNTVDNNGDLPIHIACLRGHLSATKYFITEKHCDPKCRGQYGRTPLHTASDGGHMDIIKYLITEQGCDPNTLDNNGDIPIHIACLRGHLSATKYFITEKHCDPKCRGQYGRTPLHTASDGGHMDIIKYLITEQGCDPNTLDNDGDLPIHIACLCGHLSATKYFITEKHCDPKCRGQYGQTPLLTASDGGHMDIIKYLITEQGCDPNTLDNNGNHPIHIACLGGHLSVTKYFIIEQHCEPTCRGQCGRTPLHNASQGGHMNIIKYLITEQGCDPNTLDNNGDLPIHIACLGGHLSATKYFITEKHCDPKCRGQYGRTPLHNASDGGHMDIIKYLITEQGCDPNTVDNNGDLPIHIACHGGHLSATKYFITEQHCDPVIVDQFKRTILHIASYNGHIDIVRWLLHNGRIDIMAKDKSGNTCIEKAGQLKNRYYMLKLFQPFVASTKLFPIHTYGKTALIGNSGAGKTTFIKVITERSTTRLNRLRFGNVQRVEGHTAGIVPSHVESWEVGKMTLFDLAGQAEYHSSHSAIMETVMQQSPATFINVIDLSNSDDEIKQQLHYWLNFIDSATSKTINRSCLIVVGSHADLLSKEQLQGKLTLFTSLVQRRVKRQEFIGFVTVDCRRIDTAGTREFISLLHKSQQVIVARAPSLSYYCHLLYAFLQSKLEMSVCTLQELVSQLSRKDSPIPSQLVNELLTALNDKGIIIFLKNQHQIEKSWIVVDTVSLLKTIDGVLFAPKHFPQHLKIVSNTGIIQSSSLKKIFPQYNLEMLVGFLQTLELCHRVNLSGITTNLQSIELSSPGDVDKLFLFFPSLLGTRQQDQPNRPCILPKEENFSFGWCLCCVDPEYHFFTSRFLHVLLLRLAYTFPLACESSIPPPLNQRRCSVWTNGIFWDNEEGIRTVVELIDHNRVVVLSSHKSGSRLVECSKHRSAVIRLILDLQQEFCSNVETDEYLICHNLLRNWPANDICLTDNGFLPIENIAKLMLLRTPYILNSTGISSDLPTQEILSFEPYYQLSPSSVCELMDSSKADELVSQSLLDEVKTRCQLPQLELQSYSCLRKCIDELSIFSGRNPIVSMKSVIFIV